MRAIFQKTGKIVRVLIWKFGQKCAKLENILKKDRRWLRTVMILLNLMLATLVLQNIWFLYVCMLCFHVRTPHVSFHLIPNVHIVRTFGNRIPFQTFEKWHNLSYRYVNSKPSNIWKIGAWVLKPFGERVEENYIYHLGKPNSTVKTRTVYRACNVYQVFLQNGKIDFRSKTWNFNINFQTSS